jgi:hypothetical protein
MNLTELATHTKTYNAWQQEAAGIWKDSLFEAFKNKSSSSKGAQGEFLCADIMDSLGHRVLRNNRGKPIRPKGAGKDFDLMIGTHRTEVKASTTWGQALNCFTWQQIRSMQDYDRVIFMGINPNEVLMWWCSKADLEANIFGRNEYRQHAGKDGHQELYWLQNTIPSWFRTMGEW